MKEFKNDFDKNTLYQILQSHGKIDECIQYAESVNHFETVIVHYVNKKEYETALKKLVQIEDGKQRLKLMYRYCSVFLKNIPELVFVALKDEKFNFIEVKKLMPNFIDTISLRDKAKLTLDYLEDHLAIRRSCSDKSLHNTIFYFYA